jgi:hypothetical protein
MRSDDQLREYVAHHLDYRTEAVEAALAELLRRGQPLSGDELNRIRSGLERRDAAMKVHLNPRYGPILGRSPTTRRTRIRLITTSLLAAGLGCATAIYLTALPKAANPLGYEPEDTKKYLRDLELYGGKVNVLATEFMRWFDGLWHGRSLAFTVAWLTIIAALAFWFLSTRLAADLDPTPPEGQGRDGTDA